MNAEQLLNKTLQDCGLNENEQNAVINKIVAGTIKTDNWGKISMAKLAESLRAIIAGTNTIVPSYHIYMLAFIFYTFCFYLYCYLTLILFYEII